MDLSSLSFFTLVEPADGPTEGPTDGAAGRGDGALAPTDLARSSWSREQLHGVAVSGALARTAERTLAALGRDDLRPARHTVDLFRPARFEPCTLTAEVVRESARICLVDVALSQHGERVARASVLFLKATESTDASVWEPTERPSPPPEDVAPPTDAPAVPFLRSDAPWSQDFRQHQNAGRKTSWNAAVPVVAGERLTPFQAAAATADGASLVLNWGSAGVQHINTDVTLALARLPRGTEVGLAALDRVEVDGIAVGTAAVFDREGPVGEVVVTSLVNARRSISFDREEQRDPNRA
ncbi:acyl-CoA thioesterase domain-containing protein [Nocardioides dongxiaopingii]|uniref:acyl-CoA thioesterase domain-containing protein n=1 Tax=Nocardioides dongxiaopingii TaxID=2576036 RepID=UPI001FE9A434|nr:acyl-CoA thioesterase domain-containing protein [Nocardioides dongxiaopingii]